MELLLLQDRDNLGCLLLLDACVAAGPRRWTLNVLALAPETCFRPVVVSVILFLSSDGEVA